MDCSRDVLTPDVAITVEGMDAEAQTISLVSELLIDDIEPQNRDTHQKTNHQRPSSDTIAASHRDGIQLYRSAQYHDDLDSSQENTGVSSSTTLRYDTDHSYSAATNATSHQLESVPVQDGVIAFGTIKIYSVATGNHQLGQSMIRGLTHDDKYPNLLIDLAVHRRWIRLDGLTLGTISGTTHLRVYVLPEDVGRGNRGSVQQFRKVIKYLLNFVDASAAAWIGEADPQTLEKTYHAPISKEEESLFYTFNTLESPNSSKSDYGGDDYGYQALTDAMDGNIIGLKTTLYPYQRRSVAAMIKKEADPAKLQDPRKVLHHDIYGNQFYLDAHDGSLVHDQLLYTEPQGGILAETMGYGKTLICLALILATRGHYPQIPQERVDIIPFEPRAKTASLLSMAARRLKHEGIPWKNELQSYSKEGYYFERCINELKKYDRAYAEPIFTPTTPNRKGKRESANIVRLCPATLIIVPPNLLIQWKKEIETHVEENGLDVLVIETLQHRIPRWQELVQYDIILMSKARFEQEYRDDDLHQGKAMRGQERYRSPLTDVRWLRVICDEGHGFAGSSSKTKAIAMLDNMFVERRWVVSGTPSSSLHGVEIGLSTSATSSQDSAIGRKESVNSVLTSRKTPDALTLEAKDLERLRLIVVNFLKLQPWANQRGSTDRADWRTYLASIVDNDGQRRSKPALREVMQTLIVRHRIHDLDADLELPPLHNRVICLDPCYFDKMAINLFIMLLASNYATSEREDEDYMFHPRNRKKLDLLISNLRHATFHWTGIDEIVVQETLKVSNEYLNQNIDKVSDSDGLLLTEAITTGQRALSDPAWKAMTTLHEIGAYVTDLPVQVREAWSMHSTEEEPCLIGTVPARDMQKYVRSRLSKTNDTDPFAGLTGAGVKSMNTARERASEELNQRQKSKLNENEKLKLDLTDEVKLKGVPTSSSPHKSGQRSKSKSSSSTVPTAFSSIPETTHPSVSRPRVVGFTSAKLTYLADQILEHSPSEKCIIFYDHNNTAFWIAEALELLGISFLIFANTLSISKRAQYLDQFNSDVETRVLLMDLKQAGQGLHVAVASRVYIVSPIWNASVESQAVKRAHRIGQVRPVYVETLVLGGTFEEAIIKRRQDKENRTPRNQSNEQECQEDQSSQSALLDDQVIVDVLKNVEFLSLSDDEPRLVKLTSPQSFFARQKEVIEIEPRELGDKSLISVDLHKTKRKVQFVFPGFEGNHEEPATVKRVKVQAGDFEHNDT